MKLPSILKSILILAGTGVVLTVVHLSASFLVPVLFGIFFAILLTPVINWFLRHRMPKWLALILSIGLLLLIALFVVLLVGRSLSVLETSLEEYEWQFSQRQAELAAQLEELPVEVDSSLVLSATNPENLVGALKYLVTTLVDILKDGFVILMLTIFLLIELPVFKVRMSQAFGAESGITQNLLSLARTMIRYFSSRALVNLVNAIATGVMLWAFGIPHVGLWVVLIFFLSFIPYIGAILSMIPPVLIAYAQSGLGVALLVILLSIIINAVSENIVQPMVLGVSLSVSPTVVFLSTLFWLFILGGQGAFLAMPLTMAVILAMRNFSETRGLAEMVIRNKEVR
jgi:predicted PurR-regulated permease PerM